MAEARRSPEYVVWQRTLRRKRAGRLATLLFLSVAVGVGLGTGQSLTRVRSLKVVSPDPSVADEVRAKLVLPAGANLLTTSVAPLATQAEQCPRVAKAEIDRRLPGELILTVTPRAPLFALRQGAKYALIDREGMCLYRCARPQPEVLRVEGLDQVPLEVGRRFAGEWFERSRDVAEALLQSKVAGPWHLDATGLPDLAVVSRSGARGLVGLDADISKRVRLFAEVLQGLEARGKQVGVMELRTRRPIWWPRTPSAASRPSGRA